MSGIVVRNLSWYDCGTGAKSVILNADFIIFDTQFIILKCKIHRTLIRAVDRLEGEVHEPLFNFVFCVAIYGVNGMVGIDMR